MAAVSKREKSLLEQRNTAWLEGRSVLAHGHLVLIADDSEADIFFLLRAFASSGVRNPIHVVRTGAEALEYFQGRGHFANRQRFPLPGIVFLDLRLPRPDGFELLRWKNSQPDFQKVLFVAMSNFDSLHAINQAYDAGAKTFLAKPLDPQEIKNAIESFEQFSLLPHP